MESSRKLESVWRREREYCESSAPQERTPRSGKRGANRSTRANARNCMRLRQERSRGRCVQPSRRVTNRVTRCYASGNGAEM